MLDPQEEVVFDGMVTRLRVDDPTFAHRLDRLTRPRRRRRVAIAILLWVLVPVCLANGGWTGALMAALAGMYGTYLFRKRHEIVPPPIWWNPPRFSSR